MLHLQIRSLLATAVLAATASAQASIGAQTAARMQENYNATPPSARAMPCRPMPALASC